MGGYIDIKRLNLDELMGVVNLYPWFAGARKELCVRMSHMGVDIMEESQCAEAAMYLPSRRILSDIRRASRTQVWKDCDVEEIINIQPAGNKAKPYQVKQIRNIILKYKLGGNINA